MNQPVAESVRRLVTAQAAPLPDVLLVEDDEGDAFLVRELLAEASAAVAVERVATLAEARQALRQKVRCVLLDLGLPDVPGHPDGLGALRALLETAPTAPVLVLTGHADEARGIAAVAAGAQDYLVKGQIDGPGLARAVRYAVERRRAEESARRLYEAEMQQRENTRLANGLLPQPQLRGLDLTVHARYRPGQRRLMLGGDFYDVVEDPTGHVHLLVGDVCGHGPDEAALGVCLRVAWRTLVLAGLAPAAILPTLEQVLIRERRSEEIFASVCQLVLEPDRRRGLLWLAGHPVPVVMLPGQDEAVVLSDEPAGPPLGAIPGLPWDGQPVVLPAEWDVVLYSDGLIEGYAGAATPADAGRQAGASERLGLEGLLGILAQVRRERPALSFVDEVIAEVERRNGGPLTDDLAVLLVGRSASSEPDETVAPPGHGNAG